MGHVTGNTTRCESFAVGDISAPLIASMWELFSRHYHGCDRTSFERDLSEKHRVLILTKLDQLIGFTSQRFETIDGHRVTYSGDVIITPSARNIGTAHFFHQWACAVWKQYDWWCYLAAGPRTYRIPHTFYKRVTPSRASNETQEECSLRHAFAEHAYGNNYSRHSGIVQLDHAYTLPQQEREIRSNYPMDDFFRNANPGWQQGDELVSLISLHERNWKPIALRMLNWQTGND